MIDWTCPLGKYTCNSCTCFTTGGCTIKNQNATNSITQEQERELWKKRRTELMALSKEDLVELIMGPEPFWMC